MAARRCRRLLVPLLTLALMGAASAAAPTPEEAARIARTAIDRAQYDLAAKTIDDALQRFGSQQTETMWTMRVMRGEILNARLLRDAAREALAEEPPAALRNSVPAVRRHLELAYAWYGYPESAKHLEAAQRIATAHQPRVIAEVYAKYAALGPPKQTEEYAAKAIREARRIGDRFTEARATAAPVYALSGLGRFSDAVGWGEKALPLLQSLGLVVTLERTEGNLGWAYIELGNFDAAAELFTQAEASAARIGSSSRAAWLNQLGNLRVHSRDWAGAERYYRQALQLGPDPQILANLAVVAIETGRLDDARRYNAQALALKKEPESVLHSLIINARIAAATGDLSGATAILNRVIQDTHDKTTQWEARGRLAEVFVKGKRFGDADQQFRQAIETVRETRAAIDRKELRLGFFNTTADIFNAYIDFLVSQQRIAAALDATEIIRIDALDDALGRQTSPQKIDARAIARQENATILSYWLGPRQSYVWKITPDAIRAATLAPDSKISAAVDAYRRDLTSPRGTLELSGPRGQQLYALLGKPKGSRVVIIPDGSLYALNFETLVSPRRHYWIEDALVSEASSIRALAERRRADERPATMLLIGNPPSSDPAFPPLPRADDEIRSVARHFARAKVLEGAAATPAAYRSASPNRFDYVHFVAHGIATRTRPLESAVILAGGKLLARDVVQQPLAARLVTISSCHGAGTRAYTGEGLVGLAWAFLRAGASSVIAALWEVSDSATPQLMDRFYGKTAAGADPAAALRDAKLALLQSESVYRYPRYWAPFVYYE